MFIYIIFWKYPIVKWNYIKINPIAEVSPISFEFLNCYAWFEKIQSWNCRCYSNTGWVSQWLYSVIWKSNSNQETAGTGRAPVKFRNWYEQIKSKKKTNHKTANVAPTKVKFYNGCIQLSEKLNQTRKLPVLPQHRLRFVFGMST